MALSPSPRKNQLRVTITYRATHSSQKTCVRESQLPSRRCHAQPKR
jgi:hypothetical protein